MVDASVKLYNSRLSIPVQQYPHARPSQAIFCHESLGLYVPCAKTAVQLSIHMPTQGYLHASIPRQIPQGLAQTRKITVSGEMINPIGSSEVGGIGERW